MPRLRKMRLVSIGHNDSRYSDVTLKFTDRGDRPTNSVLWLRNGGGKTQLLGLFFAGVRPNKREFLGQRAEEKVRSIDDCVAKQDHGLVVCEWELDAENTLFNDEPPIYLTGVFYEWPSNQSDNGKPGVDRLFFAAKPTGAVEQLTLDGLPIFSRGENQLHRRHLKGFQRELGKLDKANPEQEVFFEKEQHKFIAELNSHGIDPEVFRYQIRMNEREGGASELFSFSQDSEFIDFLLEMAFSQQKADDVRDQLSTFREELVVRNEQLKPELTYCEGLMTRLTKLVGVQREREIVFADTAASQRRLLGLKSWISTRSGNLTDESKKRQELLTESESEADVARKRADKSHRAAAVNQRHACQLRFDQIDKELQSARRDHSAALRLKNIWSAAKPLARCWEARRQARLYREQLARKQQQYAPDLARLKGTAARLANALDFQTTAAKREETSESEAAKRLEQEAKELYAKSQHEGESAAKEEGEAKQLQQNLQAADTELTLLRTTDALNEREDAPSGKKRLEGEIATGSDTIRELESGIAEQKAFLKELAEKSKSAEQSAAGEKQQLDLLKRDMSTAEDLRRKLESDASLLRLLQADTVDLDAAASRAVETATEELRRITETILRIRIESAEDQRALDWLRGEGELLPPSGDVQTILEWLINNDIRAWSGWEYIEANRTPNERRSTIERVPFVATGVVVASKDYERVLDLTTDGSHPSALRTAVTIVPTEVLSDDHQVTWTVIGPEGDAHFDRNAAALELNRLEKRGARREEEINDHTLWQQELTSLRERLRSFQSSYPSGWFSRQRQKIEGADARWKEALAQSERVNRQRNTVESEIQDATSARDNAIKEEADRKRRLDRVESFIRQFADHVDRWSRDLAKAQQASKRHRAQQQRFTEKAESNRDEATERSEAAVSARFRATQLEAECNRLKYIDDSKRKSVAGPVETLRSDYETLLKEYEDKVNSETLEQLANDKDAEFSKERTEFERVLGQFPDIAESDVEEELRTLPEHMTAPIRSEEVERSEHQAMVRAGNFGNKLRPKREELNDAEQRCEKLSETGELPSVKSQPSEQEYQREADRLNGDAEEQLQLAGEFDTEINTLAAQLTDIDHELDTLGREQRNVESMEANNEELFQRLTRGGRETDQLQDRSASVKDVNDLARQLTEVEASLRQLRTRHTKLDESRDMEAAQIASWSRKTRFAELPTSISHQFATKRPDVLETKSEFFITQLEDRLLEIERKLEEADRHHDRVVGIVAAAVDDGLNLLKRVERMSKLPDTLPLAGKHFIRIHTKASDNPAERRAKIAELIGELIQSGEIGDGLSLVQKGVRRVAVHTKVRVLHPDLRSTRRLSMSELRGKSGGERLTCAILLYCALLRLRRHSGGRHGSSVLFLDNPIGTASRIAFLDLQREVAESMNVQLIYATAVQDLNAIGALENVIRLRNSRVDRRTNRRMVELEGDGEWSGQVDAARIVFDTPPGSVVGGDETLEESVDHADGH